MTTKLSAQPVTRVPYVFKREPQGFSGQPPHSGAMIADLIFLTPQSNRAVVPLIARSLEERSKAADPLFKLLAGSFRGSGDTSQGEVSHEIFYQTSRTTLSLGSGGNEFRGPFFALWHDDESEASGKETEHRLARARRVAAELQEICGPKDLSGEEEFARVELLVQRYGKTAIDAIGDLLFRLPTTSELVSILVLVLARVQDEETKKDRQALLISALESRHPSMRYLAAAAFGEIGDSAARQALSERLKHERNRSVAAIIRASLR